MRYGLRSPLLNLFGNQKNHEVAEHEILLAFRALLSSDSERFLPSAGSDSFSN